MTEIEPTTGSQQPETEPAPRTTNALIILIFPLLGLFAALAIILSSGDSPRVDAEGTPLPVRLPSVQRSLLGQPAPDFALRTLAQTEARLSDYAGRVVFLNFWATWCVPCRREMPAFAEFMADNPGSRDPVVLAVNLGETYDQVNEWLTEQHITGIPVLFDVEYDVADQYGVGPIPVTLVIDPEGVVRFAKYGEITREEMDEYLAALAEAA